MEYYQNQTNITKFSEKILFLFRLPRNFVADRCYKDGHQRRNDIEETVWKIGKRADFKHRCLGHTAGIPWNEYGNHCSRVLDRTAEKLALIPSLLIKFLVKAAGKEN